MTQTEPKCNGVPISSEDKRGWCNNWNCLADWYERHTAYSYSYSYKPWKCEQRRDFSASLNEETQFQGDHVLQAGWRLIYSMTSQITQRIRLIQQLWELRRTWEPFSKQLVNQQNTSRSVAAATVSHAGVSSFDGWWSLSQLRMGEGRRHSWMSAQLTAKPYVSIPGIGTLLKGTLTVLWRCPGPSLCYQNTGNPPASRPSQPVPTN